MFRYIGALLGISVVISCQSATLVENAGPTKSCKKQGYLGIWTDRNGDKSSENEDFLGHFKSYSGSEDAASNYNYYSHSAHPKVGPQPDGRHSNVFFYADNAGLNFNFFHNIDEGGSANNKVLWAIETSGNNSQDKILLSDDPGELKELSQSNGRKVYRGDFQYWLNTDGGVIGPFVTDDFTISVKYLNNGDLLDISFYSDGEKTVHLNRNDLGNSDSFLITRGIVGTICD